MCAEAQAKGKTMTTILQWMTAFVVGAFALCAAIIAAENYDTKPSAALACVGIAMLALAAFGYQFAIALGWVQR